MSVLPDKTIKVDYSLIGVGAIILKSITLTDTVTSLWEKNKDHDQINTYEKFISGMVFLYIIGAIKYTDGIVTKKQK